MALNLTSVMTKALLLPPVLVLFHLACSYQLACEKQMISSVHINTTKCEAQLKLRSMLVNFLIRVLGERDFFSFKKKVVSYPSPVMAIIFLILEVFILFVFPIHRRQLFVDPRLSTQHAE